jgi:flagellar motor switch protein FliN/FliY
MTYIDCHDLDNSIEYIEVETSFNYSTLQLPIIFFIPQAHACTIEHKMLGEMDDKKESIDDDMIDAIQEITSNIAGAIANSINAQEDDVLSNVKFSIVKSQSTTSTNIEECSKLLSINISTEDTTIELFISLHQGILSFFDTQETMDNEPQVQSDNQNSSNNNINQLSEKESDNLKLLMGIELRLSVRLGSKEMLLKDIVKLDLGDIVELDQLVNEPLDILINGTKVAEGEAVVVDGKFAVKIKNIGSQKDRISYLRIAN